MGWTLTILITLSLSACAVDDVVAESGDGGSDGDGDVDGDVDGDADGDADRDTDADGPGCEVACGDLCCTEGQRCFRDGCVVDNGECGEGDPPCQNDTSCVDGVCLPFGADPVGDFDPGCTREPQPLESFEPQIQCEWPGEHDIVEPTRTGVRVPPLVADLDGDEVPEIVFSSWGYAVDGGLGVTIRAIRGDDCSPLWDSHHSHDGNEALALADLNGDGQPEICGRSSPYEGACVPFCLSAEGALFWEGHDAEGSPVHVDCDSYGVGISVANVDGVGSPEVVVGLSVFDGPTGEYLQGLASPGNGLSGGYGIIPALADVDGDGHVEALTGGWVVDLVTAEIEHDWGSPHGFTAVAELSSEHEGPEIVAVSPGPGEIRVHALDGTVIYEHSVPGGRGGAPTVADLDGDGFPEFSTAGAGRLTAFDLDCVGAPAPGRCLVADGADDGVLWSVAVDEGSGVTSSSVFDFEGDGAVEVVFGDHSSTRVFDGESGAVKFTVPHQSITGIENPVVADVDGDFYTELIVTHEGPQQEGVAVYRDRTDRWVPSRPLWSQHAEHITQRNDDGTVPVVEASSWESHNSYRQQHPREGGTALDVPDLTVGGLGAEECDQTAQSQPLSALVCNRGALPVAAGVDLSLRLGSPDGEELCSLETEESLEPGSCLELSCLWEGVPTEVPHQIFAVVDSDGEDTSECHEDNNMASFTVRCPPELR